MSTGYRILHIITRLTRGGSQMMLYKLLSMNNKELFEPSVLSLMDEGPLQRSISNLGIPLYTVKMQQGSPPTLTTLREIRQLVSRLQPHLVQGWTYHGNIAATFSTCYRREKIPVVWNIRQSLYDLQDEKRMTAILIRLGKHLSSNPKKIIYNSRLSANQHEALGYSGVRRQIIPNGFDCELFQPSHLAYTKLRRELGLPQKAVIIGLIARYHPMKDIANFIRAAKLLMLQRPDTYFILVGRELTDQNLALQNELISDEVKQNIYLLGERFDVSEVMAGLDVLALSSWSEAFPNVLGEAMACGIPCVATDVGDASWIIGNTGIVVPPRDAQALCQGWCTLLDLNSQARSDLGKAARQRIIDNFSLSTVVEQYNVLYQTLLEDILKTGA